LELPLKPILERLPMDLRSRITMPISGLGQAGISIPVGQVLPQLAVGSVKILFGQLRQAAPSLFSIGAEYDEIPVPLPLNEVLPRLNPKLLTRSPGKRNVQVADDIVGPFGLRTKSTTFATTPAPPAAAPSLHTTAPPATQQIPPAARPTPAAERAITPVSDAVPPPAPQRSAPVANHFSAAPAPVSGAPARTTPPVAAKTSPPETAASTGDPVLVPLSAVAGLWPEPMRAEFAQLNLSESQIALPLDQLATALKRGRVVFPWRTLRTVLRPVPITAVSARDNLQLNFPLKLVVPLFLAQYKPSARKTWSPPPAADIPDLISGGAKSSPATLAPKAATIAAPPRNVSPTPPARASVPCAPAAPPKPSPPPKPASKPVDARIAETDFYVWSDTSDTAHVDITQVKRAAPPRATDFIARRLTPKEMVSRAMALPGVVGTVVALPDGLPVASQLPPGMDADHLAAFLPQIFDRVSHSAAELQMGGLDNLSFTVGNVPWTIFRGNVFRASTIYFAAFGRAGQTLPGAQLAALVSELDHNHQP
jgi:Roadblock/LC7 domain